MILLAFILPTVPHRNLRLLLLWLFVALQAMTPFIHAHAGAVQLDHGGFLHVHQGAQVDAARHVAAADAHGAEVAVAQGMRLRDSSLDAISEALPHPSVRLLRITLAARPGAAFPTPPALDLAFPEHTLPHALAPPAA